MNKLIKNEQEFQDFCAEVRNRQYEVDPIKIEFIDSTYENHLRFSSTSTYDWDNEYLQILRINNVDIVKHMVY